MSENPAVETEFYKTPITDEPIKPTEEPDVTKQDNQAPEQDVELDKPVEIETEIKADKSESDDEEQESHYVEIDGKEIDLEDVRKWRDGHLMQSDYTKKTTALADERKTFNAERDTGREDLLKSQTEVTEMRDLLSVLVAEDESIDWAELKEDDPDRYIVLKEKADNRKDALEKVKSERNQPVDDPATIADEQRKLFSANPDWLDADNKPTESYTKDTTLMNDYAVNAGFTTEEFSQLTRAHHMMTILKAAKYDALQEKSRKINKKREKVPVVTKPKANKSKEQSTSMADTFYSKTG